MRKMMILLAMLCGAVVFGQGVGQGFTPSASVVDSTRLDTTGGVSVLKYWRDGVVVGVDTIKADVDVALVKSLASDTARFLIDSIENEFIIGPGYNKFYRSITEKGSANIAVLSDSKGDTRYRGFLQLRTYLYEKYGYGSPGYAPFGSQMPGFFWYLNSGGDVISTTKSLSGYATTLNDVGDFYWMYPTGERFNRTDKVRVYYQQEPGAGAAIVRYGDITTPLDASGVSEKKYIEVVAPEGLNSLRITLESGEITFYEAYFTNSQNKGITFNRIARGGYTAAGYAGIFSDPENMELLDSMNLDAFLVRLGTNDQSAGTSPSAHVESMKSIVTSVKSASDPGLGVIWVLLEPNGRQVSGFTNEEYVDAQNTVARDSGYSVIPLNHLIPNWNVWADQGYVEINNNMPDDVHSNSKGGDIIGEFYTRFFSGDYSFYQASSTTGVSAPDGQVIFGSGNGVSSENNLFYDRINDRLGLRSDSPSAALDLPIGNKTNNWYLSGLRYDFGQGLRWNADGEFGTSPHGVTLNLTGYPFTINGSGSSSGLLVNGQVPVRLGTFFDIDVFGNMDYDGSAGTTGRVLFKMGPGSDILMRLGTGSASEFKVSWGASNVEKFKVDFNSIDLSSSLIMNSLPSTDPVDATGVLFRGVNNVIQEAPWSSLLSKLDTEGLATDADLAILRSGSGSPEGVVTAPPGTLYLNSAGGAGTTLYVKETGTGNTGWIAK